MTNQSDTKVVKGANIWKVPETEAVPIMLNISKIRDQCDLTEPALVQTLANYIRLTHVKSQFRTNGKESSMRYLPRIDILDNAEALVDTESLIRAYLEIGEQPCYSLDRSYGVRPASLFYINRRNFLKINFMDYFDIKYPQDFDIKYPQDLSQGKNVDHTKRTHSFILETTIEGELYIYGVMFQTPVGNVIFYFSALVYAEQDEQLKSVPKPITEQGLRGIDTRMCTDNPYLASIINNGLFTWIGDRYANGDLVDLPASDIDIFSIAGEDPNCNQLAYIVDQIRAI